MGNYVSEQMLSFLQSIALGAALALVYDLLAALRGLGGRIWGGVLDVLFCLTCAISVFLFVMAGSGELRVFMVMGIVGGAVLFWCLLGSLLRPVWAFWLALALLPARLAAGLLKKCAGAAKKVFSFWQNWFIMKFISLHQKNAAAPEEGADTMAAPPKGKKNRTPPKKPKPVKSTGGKLTIFLLSLLLLGISIQIFRMFDQLQAAREEETAYAQQLAELKEANQQLKEDLDNSGSQALIEDIARDKFGFVLPNEKVFYFSK